MNIKLNTFNCKYILFLFLGLNGIISATPPSEPKKYDEIEGEILYAVWHGRQEVSEIRLDDPDDKQGNEVLISNRPTWYLVISPIGEFKKIELSNINRAISLRPLFPQIPKIEVFPDNSLLVAFEGDKSLPVSIGKSIKIINFKFQILEDGSGGTDVDQVIIK